MSFIKNLLNIKKKSINQNKNNPENINNREYPVYDSSGTLSDKVISFILGNRYEDLESAIRGVKKVWFPHGNGGTGEFRYIKKERHCYSEEVIENILSKLQGWLSIDIKMAVFNSGSFPLFMSGGVYKGEEVDGLLDLIVDYFEEITKFEVPKFKKFIDGVRTPYPEGNELSDEEVYMLCRESSEICNLVRVRVYTVFSRAVGGQENKATHGNVKNSDKDSLFGNDFIKDLDKL